MALARTFNALHYVETALAFLARGPRWVLAAMGPRGRSRAPRIGPADVARLEAVVARLLNVDELIESRFATLRDRQALRHAEHTRQLAELAERLDLAERVLAQQRPLDRLGAAEDGDLTTPVWRPAARFAGPTPGSTVVQRFGRRPFPTVVDQLALPSSHRMPNLKLAVRTLVRTPLVTSVAIASLALGIGANTAIFSLIQRVLLQSLPVPEPDRLVNIIASGPNPGSQSCNRSGSCSIIFSYPMFRDLERGQRVLTGLAGFRTVYADLSFRGRSVSGEGVSVSGSYFPVLGLNPALGRLLGPADDGTPEGHPVVVLAFRYWMNDLGGDPAVLGQSILINGHPMTIVGVAPRGFEGTTLGARPRVFLPLTMRRVVEPWSSDLDDRRSYWVYAFGRLRDGVTRRQAAEQLNAVYRPIITDVELSLQEGITNEMRAQFRAKTVTIEPGHQGMSNLRGQTRTPLALLFAVTGIVLLVACTNVANLLLARAAGRASEFAVRSSLGASRRQLIGQLFAEAAILAATAGAMSLLVARGTLSLITSFLPGQLAGMVTVAIDGPVLAFAALAALGTSLLFGLFPALHSTRSDLLAVTKADPGRGSVNRRAVRFRNALVIAQIALSMTLLSAAGLFIRSLANVNRIQLGIDTGGVASFSVAPPLIGYDSVRTVAIFERLASELRALPGVISVSNGLVPVLRGWSNGTDVDVDGFPTTPDADVNVHINYVGVDYFKTLRIPVLAGREFTPADAPDSPPVAIVNEAFAKKFRLGANPIGRRMRLGNALAPETRNMDRPFLEIIGLVKDAAYSEVKLEMPPMVFVAAHQRRDIPLLTYYVRTPGSPEGILGTIEPLMAKLAPEVPVSNRITLADQARESIYLDRMISAFSSGFAILATLLAAVGLYGVLAYTITQRTREIGLRMALGADAHRVRVMVLRQVGWMTCAGVAAGVLAALAVGRTAQSLLYGLEPHDVKAFTAAGLLLALVAAAAGLAPAVRASRVHPMEALRAE